MSEQQYKEWFQHVDKDGSGTLTYSELYDFLTEQRGYTQQQVERIFDSADQNKDDRISLEEYLAIMSNSSKSEHSQSAMRMVCRGFDTNGDGTIDRAELKALFAELGRHMSEEEIDRIVKMTDTDGDGSIDYNELCEKVFGQSCD